MYNAQNSIYKSGKKESGYFVEYQLISPRRLSTSAIEQVLLNRGIEDAQHYLNTTDADILDPLLLDNMCEGAEMLLAHIKNGDKAYVQIDCD